MKRVLATTSLLLSTSAGFVSRPLAETATTSQCPPGNPLQISSATDSAPAYTAPRAAAPLLDGFDHHSDDRLPYSKDGYLSWEWSTHHNPAFQEALKSSDSPDKKRYQTCYKVNYVEMGGGPADAEGGDKPVLLLVHGFGASAYHWRYNIPVLARKYHVYALDLLGFGWTDKPVQDYDASVWRDQVVDFVHDVVLDGGRRRRDVAIAGNSLGGYTALFASTDERLADVLRGTVLLNGAGQFRDPDATPAEEEAERPNPIIESVSAAIQRFVIACSFVYTKQPMRIAQILKNVYPVTADNVDRELVSSIHTPALDPDAPEVFFRVITRKGRGEQPLVDDLLRELKTPLLLAWGREDPWIRPAAADKIEMLHAEFHGDNGGSDGPSWLQRVDIDAGHCPHDENPVAVNKAILDFAEKVFDVTSV